MGYRGCFREWTCRFAAQMSAYDPKRKIAV